jgi:hypothetical protein
VTRAFAVLFGTLGMVGCTLQSPVKVPDGNIFQGSTDPAQYQSTHPRDARGPTWRETAGAACRTLLSWPPNPPTPFLGSEQAAAYLPWNSFTVAAGNDGYALAVSRARERAGGGILFDVRADTHTTSILGIWRRECIEVHGIVAR